MEPAQRQANDSDRDKRMDWVGAASIVGLSVMILLSLDLGGVVSPWNSPKVLGLLLGGLVLLAGFIFWEGKGTSIPIMPFRLMNGVSKVSPLVVCFTHGFVNVSSWYFLPLYFQAVWGASPTYSGVLLMPIVVVQAFVGLAAGGITYRFGWINQLIWIGMVLMTLGFGLFIHLGTSPSLAGTVLIQVVAAIGVGSSFQAPLIAYQSAVGTADMAVATSLFGFIRSLSTSISVVVGGVVFQNGMAKQKSHLISVLGPSLAQNFSASTAAANIFTIHSLPLDQQVAVKHAYVSSLRGMWAMYASVGGLGLVAALFMKYNALTDRDAGSSAAAADVIDLRDQASVPAQPSLHTPHPVSSPIAEST
ncbi:hypothetical protein LTR10_014444 [Elasticomyces elasticus]|uniref:Major facilitator superfamily (MFS) profile domain-containing protein n=1 Tax=Exophiala sideris TaxID=1016849 RepID=A0ABR0J0L8_9EURO|nr:hypothetical protein LTR10_014444 [Elasticomyces elasticus]KAK5023642.1 hypothetical protein LTS07_009150 [Exophiala sideris]KAK5029642.1 hypothetical protein LTR13_008562 [Exophiala sideris]KAK5053431.1 hypothetical protein LTR69_009389 [Exophiala sideris]KAK5179189.1 hypothetical protein LTR44_008343 [Eurotiomycetes sp. CCFEE 6388]